MFRHRCRIAALVAARSRVPGWVIPVEYEGKARVTVWTMMPELDDL